MAHFPIELMQRLPEAPYRVGTGPFKIGNDWPGLFVRGDICLGALRPLLMEYAREHPEPDLAMWTGTNKEYLDALFQHSGCSHFLKAIEGVEA